VRVVSPAGARNAGLALTGPGVRPATVLQVALLLLFTTTLGRIPAIDLGQKQAMIFASDLGVIAVLIAGSLVMLRSRSLRLDYAAIAALIFAGIGAASAFAAIPRFELSAFEVFVSLAYLARWMVYFGVYVVIINCVREDDVAPIWGALELAILAFAAFGVFQAIFLPDFGQTLFPESRPYIDIDPQGHRLVSTLLEPNIAAAMILTVLLVQIAQLAAGVPVKRWKPAFLLLALILTLSRSGVAGFIAGMLVILAARGLGKRMLRFFGVALVVVLASLPWLLAFARQYAKLDISGGSGLAVRIISWQQAIEVFLESPWYGIGFNTFGFVQSHRGFERMGSSSYSVEGGLLFVAVMTGIIGLLVYLMMLWLPLRRSRRVWRDANATPEERGLATGAAAATVAIVVHSVFVNSLLVPFVMEPLWVLWGLGFVIGAKLRRQQQRRSVAESLTVGTPA
jgi:hypothetical protein